MDNNSNDGYAARALMVSFFLPEKWQVLVVFCTGIWFVARTVQIKQARQQRDYRSALLFGSLFLAFLASVPFTPEPFRSYLLHLCERKVALLLIPLLFAFIDEQFRRRIAGELPYFVYGSLIACLAGNADFCYHLLALKNVTASHVAYRVIMERFTGIHPTYLGMFLAWSVCIALFTEPAYYLGRVGRYVVIYALLVCLLALLVKSALIALAVILLHYAWLRRKRLMAYRWHIIILGVAVVAACLFIPFIGQRVGEVFSFIGGHKPASAADNSVATRQLIVQQDVALLRNHWLTGIGPGRVLHALRERYFFYAVIHGDNVGSFDPHSEYFQELLSFGIAGLLLLAIVLFTHYRVAWRTRNHLYLYCLLILTMTFFTETVLSRQEGVLFFSVFTSLFFFSKERSNPLKE